MSRFGILALVLALGLGAAVLAGTAGRGEDSAVGSQAEAPGEAPTGTDTSLPPEDEVDEESIETLLPLNELRPLARSAFEDRFVGFSIVGDSPNDLIRVTIFDPSGEDEQVLRQLAAQVTSDELVQNRVAVHPSAYTLAQLNAFLRSVEAQVDATNQPNVSYATSVDESEGVVVVRRYGPDAEAAALDVPASVPTDAVVQTFEGAGDQLEQSHSRRHYPPYYGGFDAWNSVA